MLDLVGLTARRTAPGRRLNDDHRPRRISEGRSTSFLSSRLPIVASGVLAFLTVPQLSRAADLVFSVPTEFEAKLISLSAATGANTLSFTGSGSPLPILRLTQSVQTPANGGTLAVHLGASELYVDDGTTTIGRATTVNLGTTGGGAGLQLGSAGKTGELHIDGGTVNFGNTGKTNQVRIGFYNTDNGILRITNGGQLNIGTEPSATHYAGFFAGYQGGEGSILLDNGHIEIGKFGASMRFGMGSNATIELKNGSSIHSLTGASHFRVGEYAGGTASLLIDNSSLIIKGGGTGSGIDDRYFSIGYDGGSGFATQRGDSSHVEIVGLPRIGIAHGMGTYGEYNLEAGRLIIGSDTIRSNFRVAYSDGSGVAEGHFNISGGHATIWGNLNIAQNSRMVGDVREYSSGIVTLTGGLLEVKGKVNFGSGIGSVKVLGGTLAMGGTNAFGGSGSVEFGGGTLLATSDLVTNHAFSLVEGGAIFDTNGYTITSKDLVGVGGVEVIGGGRLIMNSTSNAYSGGTHIRDGVVEIRANNALGTGSVEIDEGGIILRSATTEFGYDILVNGAAYVDYGSVQSHLGDVSGDGDFEIRNGTVTFAGEMSHSGTTSVIGGATLITSASNRLSEDSTLFVDAASAYRNGADLEQSLGGISGTGSITSLGNSVLNIGANGGSSSFGGQLIGASASVRKWGAGSLTLEAGASGDLAQLEIIEGMVSVDGRFNATTILLDGGGRLQGIGSVGGIQASGRTGSGGVIAPGNSIGTMTVDGDVDFNGLIYEAELGRDGSSDHMIVNGVASMNGGTLRLLAIDGELAVDHAYTILTGDFDEVFGFTVEEDFAFYDAALSEIQLGSNQDLTVTLTRNALSFADLGTTPNQLATGIALDSLADSAPLKSRIAHLTTEAAVAAFDALSGEIHASAKTAAIEETHHVQAAFNERLRIVNSGGAGVWAVAFGAEASTEGNGDFAKFERNSRGILAGVDADVEGWKLGAIIGAGNGSFDAVDRPSYGSTDTIHLGVYGGTSLNHLGLRFGLGYARSSVETSREVNIGQASEVLEASYNNAALHLFGEMGYRIEGAQSVIEPFVNAAHIRLRNDGYSERGGDGALTSTALSSEATFATIGLHTSTSFEVPGATFTARGTLGWQHAFGDLSPSATHRFNGSDAFSVAGAGFAENTALIEVGVDVSLAEDAMLSVSYGGAFAKDSREHRGQIGVNIRF